MSNAVFLRPDENGNWGQVGVDPTTNMSSLLTFQSGATALGNGTAVDVSGYTTLTLQVVISGTATVIPEFSQDGTTWNIPIGQTTVAGSTSTGTTSTTSLRYNVSSYKFFRARISAYTSGTVDVFGYASTGSLFFVPTTALYGNSDTNSTSTNLQGVGAYNLLYDGTNWVRWRSGLGIGDGQTGAGTAAVALAAYNGTNWDKVRSINTGQLRVTMYNSVGAEPIISASLASNDGVGTGSNLIGVANYNLGFAGATYDRVRVSKVYKYIEYLNLANATATTVWTPTTSKKFRLMGITVQSTVANNVHLRDGAGGTIFSTLRFTASELHLEVNFGNGYLSSAANNVLEIYNATGSTSSFWVTAWGTEE